MTWTYTLPEDPSVRVSLSWSDGHARWWIEADESLFVHMVESAVRFEKTITVYFIPEATSKLDYFAVI